MRKPLTALLSALAVGSGLMALPATDWWCSFNGNTNIEGPTKWQTDWRMKPSAYFRSPEGQGFVVKGGVAPYSQTANRPASFSLMFYADISAMDEPTDGNNARILWSVGQSGNALSLVMYARNSVALASKNKMAEFGVPVQPGFHCFIVTYTAAESGPGSAQLYVDGQKWNEPLAADAPSQFFQIGATHAGLPSGFQQGNGLRVDALWSYGRVLTADEIAEISQSMVPVVGTTARDGIRLSSNVPFRGAMTRDELNAGAVTLKVTNTVMPVNVPGYFEYYDIERGGSYRFSALPMMYVPNPDGGGTVTYRFGRTGCKDVYGIKFGADALAENPTDADRVGFVDATKGALLPAAKWTVSGAASGDNVEVTGMNGGTCTVSWSASGMWGSARSKSLTEALSGRYLDNNFSMQNRVTLSDLPPRYDVAVIFGGDGGRFSAVTATENDAASGTTYYYDNAGVLQAIPNQSGEEAKTEAQKHPWGVRSYHAEMTEGTNVLYLSDLSANKLQLDGYYPATNQNNNGRCTIAAVMVIERYAVGSVSVAAADTWSKALASGQTFAEGGDAVLEFTENAKVFTFDTDEKLPASLTVKGAGEIVFNVIPTKNLMKLTADSRLKISCGGEVARGGTRLARALRIEAPQGIDYTIPVAVMSSGAVGTADTYTAAGTQDDPASVRLNTDGGVLTLNRGSYFVTQTANGTNTSVNLTDARVTYVGESVGAGNPGCFGVGRAAYTLNGASGISAGSFAMVNNGTNSPSSVTLKDRSQLQVTGDRNGDSNMSSVMFGHWAGDSVFSLQDSAQFHAEKADVLMGKTGGTHVINMQDNCVFSARGIRLAGYANVSTLNLGGGTLRLGEGGIGSYGADKTLTVSVTGTPTIQADAVTPLTGCCVISVAGDAVLTLDGGSGNTRLVLGRPIEGEGRVVMKGRIAVPSAELDKPRYEWTEGSEPCVTLSDEEYFAGLTVSRPVLFFRADGTQLTDRPGTQYVYNGTMADDECLHAYEFNGSLADSGRGKANLNRDGGRPAWSADGDESTDYRDGKALFTATHPYRSMSYPEAWTAAIAANLPETPKSILVAFGTRGEGSVTLMKGEKPDEVILARTIGDAAYIPMATMTVPNATTAEHLYAFVKTAREIRIYLDGSLWLTYKSDEDIGIGAGFQIGSLFGGVGNTGMVRPVEDEAGKSAINALRIYGAALPDECIARLVEEFPYVSPNGTYTRTLNGDHTGWGDAGEVWTKAGSDPVETVTSPAAGASVILNVVQETHLHISGEVGATLESVTVNGPGALTLGEGGRRIVNLGKTNINTDVTVDPQGFGMNGGPTFVADGKKLRFDLSRLRWEDFLTEAVLVFTGELTLGEGASVDALLPPEAEGWTVTKGINPQTNKFEVRIVPDPLTGTVPAGNAAWSQIVWTVGPTQVYPGAEQLAELGTVMLTADGDAVLTPDASYTLKELFVDRGGSLTFAKSADFAVTAERLTVAPMARVTFEDDVAAGFGTLQMNEAAVMRAVGNAQYPFGRGNIAVNGTLEYAGTADNAEIPGMLSGNGAGVGGLRVTSGTLALTAANGGFSGKVEVGRDGMLTNGSGTVSLPFGKNNTVINDGVIQVSDTAMLPPVSGRRGVVVLGGTTRIANDMTARAVQILSGTTPKFSFDSRDFHTDAVGEVPVSLTAETLELEGTLELGNATSDDSGAAIEGVTLKPTVTVNGMLAGPGTLGAGIALTLADGAVIDASNGAPTVAGTLTQNGTVGVTLPVDAAAGTVVLNVTGEGVAEALDLTKFAAEGWTFALNEAKNAVVLAEGSVNPPPADPEPEFVVPDGTTPPGDCEKTVLTEELKKHAGITVKPGQTVAVSVEANGVAVDPAEAYAQAAEAVQAFDNVSAVTEEGGTLVMHIAYTFEVTGISFADGQLKVDVAVRRPAPLTRAGDPFAGIPQPTFSAAASLDLIDEAGNGIGDKFAEPGAGTSEGSLSLPVPGGTKLFRVRVSVGE